MLSIQKNTIIGLLIAFFVSFGLAIPAYAHNGDTHTADELEPYVAQLQELIAKIQAQLGLQITEGTQKTSQSCYLFSRNLQLGSYGEDVRNLQKILNKNSDTQIASGVTDGAPGYETPYFGLATKAAVIKFQNKYASTILAPTGLSVGNGYVGARTRSKLNDICMLTDTMSGSHTDTTNATSDTYTSTTSDSMTLWHAPGAHDGLNVHEHGDKPPVWANEFSQKNFGHPVLFGGDEGTPNENAMKHQAFKGFTMNLNDVELYVRFHAQSNPHGRKAAFHSYEIYAKDTSGGVSFWQGWMFFGYPDSRSQRIVVQRGENPGYDPISNVTWPGRARQMISSPDQYAWDHFLQCEQWYGTGGFWSWDMGITICEASTLFHIDEYKGDVMDMTTWDVTGAVGNRRRLEMSHYGPQTPGIQGLDLPTNKWFCVAKIPEEHKAENEEPTWNISDTVESPHDCPSEWLPQYIADTFPKDGVHFGKGNGQEKIFPAQGVTLPN